MKAGRALLALALVALLATSGCRADEVRSGGGSVEEDLIAVSGAASARSAAQGGRAPARRAALRALLLLAAVCCCCGGSLNRQPPHQHIQTHTQDAEAALEAAKAAHAKLEKQLDACNGELASAQKAAEVRCCCALLCAAAGGGCQGCTVAREKPLQGDALPWPFSDASHTHPPTHTHTPRRAR